jgi:hypothetical protein
LLNAYLQTENPGKETKRCLFTVASI